MILQSGLYRHYKGNDYYVFQVAYHSETREALVVYQCLYDDYSWWVRPLSMFVETVSIDGKAIPRFQFVRDLSAAEIKSFAKNNEAADNTAVNNETGVNEAVANNNVDSEGAGKSSV